MDNVARSCASMFGFVLRAGKTRNRSFLMIHALPPVLSGGSIARQAYVVRQDSVLSNRSLSIVISHQASRIGQQSPIISHH